MTPEQARNHLNRLASPAHRDDATKALAVHIFEIEARIARLEALYHSDPPPKPPKPASDRTTRPRSRHPPGEVSKP
jgi:hypothetical protein